MTEACAAIVERDDPRLYATALFAPEPARTRLMVLYAFDCELSRATRASGESLIPRMRLQWWRDVIEAAAAGEEPKAHEVAGPLAALIRSDPALLSDMADLPGQDVLSQMVTGYEMELDLPFDQARFEAWAHARFGGRLGLAGSIMPLGPEYGHAQDRSAASLALAWGLALRTAARRAAQGLTTYLPGTESGDLAKLGRGEVTPGLAGSLRDAASAARTALKDLRKARRLEGPALVAHLPVFWEARTLRLVGRNPAAILGKLDDIDRPFDGMRLAWRVWRRRW